MEYLKRLEEEVSAWPHISVHAHRFGGREFRFRIAEVGHMHKGGIVDIPFSGSSSGCALGARSCRGASLGSRLGLDYFSRPRGRGRQARRVAHAAVIRALRSEDRR
jgi:hypothetical protein